LTVYRTDLFEALESTLNFMAMKKIIKLLLPLALLVSSLLACGTASTITITNTQGTPLASIHASAANTAAATPAINTWYSASPGIEIRYEHWTSPGDNDDTVTIVRLDPKRIHLSVAYQPQQPLSMSAWMQQTHAKVLLNGGYFDQQDNATGLVVSNGQASGQSYVGFGGMLSVNRDGTISLRSLHDQPYNPETEQVEQATQSSPMLMINGKRTQFNADAASQRRTVVAMDKQGRLLFIVSPGEAFSLDELADLLASSDLSLQTALNLDGGASSALYVNAGNQHIAIDSLSTLPIVIVVK
jgi:uncharacterized protein YigE (DUF2233 family)